MEVIIPGSCSRQNAAPLSSSEFDDRKGQVEQSSFCCQYIVSCNICNRGFRSKSTLEAHLSSPRHRWRAQKVDSEMTSQITETDSRKGDNIAKSKILGEINLLKDEGFACGDSDPKKSTLLLSKAAKKFLEVQEIEKARECLQKTLELANRCLEHSFEESGMDDDFYEDDVFEDGVSNNNNSNCNNKNDSDNLVNEDEFRDRAQTRTRIKRHRMEQMNRMYSNYKMQRGTADLYETMIQCYAESFEISLNDEEDRTGKRNSLKTSEILMNRDLTLKELADTENTYGDSLEFLVQRIIPVFAMCEVDIIREITPGIFSNIDAIYEWHRSVFLEKIEDCLEDHELLGPTFKEHEKELTDLYEEYCQSKPHADDLLAQYSEEIDQVYQTIDTSFTILDYLIKPVQRIMKYQLLIQSIIKYTRKMGEKTDSLEKALEVMEIVPKKVNDKMHLAMIIGYDKSLERDELVLQDSLDVSFGGGKAKPRKCRLFLFKEFVLVTEPNERIGRLPQYKFILELKTCRMGVTQSVENDKLKFALWTRKFKTTDIYVCVAESTEMKETWLKALGDVLTLHGSRISETMKREQSLHIQSSNPMTYMHEKSWSAEQIVRQATVGHPREYTMSTKLKANIQKFLLEELMLNDPESSYTDEIDSNKENEFARNNGAIKSDMIELSGSSFDDNEKSDPKCRCPNNGNGNLSSIKEESIVQSKKGGFKLWKSLKERNEINNNSKLTKQKKEKWKEKTISERSMSLPNELDGDFVVNELFNGINDCDRSKEETPFILDEEESLAFRCIAAETQLLLVKTESSLTWEKVDELLESSVSLFFNVKKLKEIAEEFESRESLFTKCQSLYHKLKQKKGFNRIERQEEKPFYSYDGLFRLLTTYGSLVAGNVTSTWPVFLYTLAAAAAQTEFNWRDSSTANRKLAEIYRTAQNFDYSVAVLVEEFHLQLQQSNIHTATFVLKDAFETALVAGDADKCQSLDKLGVILLEKSKENETNIDTLPLKLIIEMSNAYQKLNYQWFEQNYFRICVCDDHLHAEERHDLRDIFMHLLEHLKESKRKKSGEIFV